MAKNADTTKRESVIFCEIALNKKGIINLQTFLLALQRFSI